MHRLALVAMGFFWLSVCRALPESATTRSSSLSVFPDEIKLPVSGVHRVLVTVSDVNAAEKDVTAKAAFKSNHGDIAEVSKGGVIRALRPGSAVIEVRANRQTAPVRVTVEPSP